jgi:hypothetical protein
MSYRGMGEMTAYSMEDLVSQAETEGVTLAEMLMRSLTAEELASIEEDLKRKIDENYRSIEGFMCDVEIPSIPDFSSLSEVDLTKMQEEVLTALSDDMSALTA